MSDNLVLQKLRTMKPLFPAMGLKRVRLFGSHATGNNHPDSDVDLLVDFDKNPTLFDLSRTVSRFEKALDRPVDVILEDGIFPAYRERILREAQDV